MNLNEEHIDIELIARYLSGEASPEEKQELEAWIESSKDHSRQFEEFRKVWEEMPRVSEVAGLDLDAEWKHQKALIEESSRVRKLEPAGRNGLFMATRIAAAAVVVIALVFGGIYISRNVGNVSVDTADFSQQVFLPDGSAVTLNQNTSLVYPKRFGKDERNLSLTGEGFFDVTEDPDRPFIIDTRELDIRVLGTSFNVNAYESNSEVEVIVKTGQVAVTRRGDVPKTIILKPGNKAVYNRNQEELRLSTKIDRNYLSWKTKSFVFEDESLDHVIRSLNKVYGSGISIPSDSLRNVRITTSFTDDTLESILNVLAATLDIEVVELNGQLVLKQAN